MKLPLSAQHGTVRDADGNIIACLVYNAVNHNKFEQDYRDAAFIAKAVNAYRSPADGLTVKVRGHSVKVNVSYYQPAQDNYGADLEFSAIEIDGHDVFHTHHLLDAHFRHEIDRQVIKVLP